MSSIKFSFSYYNFALSNNATATDWQIFIQFMEFEPMAIVCTRMSASGRCDRDYQDVVDFCEIINLSQEVSVLTRTSLVLKYSWCMFL